MPLDFKQLRTTEGSKEDSRYSRQLSRIRAGGKRDTVAIEKAIDGAVSNLEREVSSFVIYGEPQSGKTEMMICLAAKLLDLNHKLIIVLLNDSIDLLDQNLTRFQTADLDPTPVNYSDFSDPISSNSATPHVLFCKKNARDLEKLRHIIRNKSRRVVIDDEADYASPNSKINKSQSSPINKHIKQILHEDGIYIGVTATPARLDLNNTFDNDSTQWVKFPPHTKYRGQETFFPDSSEFPKSFRLNRLPDTSDDPKYLRGALFSFMVGVAEQNLSSQSEEEQNYSFLIHTSGKKADHSVDYKQIKKILTVLTEDDGSSEFNSYLEQIFDIAESRFPGRGQGITEWIYKRRALAHIVVMNSDADKANSDFQKATNPAFRFTIAIGGNIISRGVTFDNLLGMFFTRDVKHKIQQDTYIQRARMFGNRGDYLRNFELSVPATLYDEWRRCFIFHRLSLKSIESGIGSPIWLESGRVSAASAPSIDRANVSINRGEMGFAAFRFGSILEEVENCKGSPSEKLHLIQELAGKNACPDYLIDLVKQLSPDSYDHVHFMQATNIAANKDADIDSISRVNGGVIRGFTASEKEGKYAKVEHIFKFSFNDKGMARLYYKYVGGIRQIWNKKNARI